MVYCAKYKVMHVEVDYVVYCAKYIAMLKLTMWSTLPSIGSC